MTGNQDLFSKAMNQGHSAAWDQMWSRAASFYRQALEEFPDNPKALTSLGLALLEAQQYEEAMACYKKAATLLPTDPMPYEKVAQICERVSRLNDAIQAYLQAADLHIKNRDMERAIECWLRITRFNAEHLVAHSRLAVANERLGRKAQAVQEYLAVASIVQRSGAPDKAVQAINYALQIVPDNPDAQHALVLVRSNQLLPRPIRTRGGTGSLRPPEVIRMELTEQINSEDSKLDPIAETRQKALVALADIVFESNEESAQRLGGRRAPGLILRGSAGATAEQAQQTTVMRHLGFAIDAQTQGNDNLAANELGKAIEAGLSHPAAYFILGLLNANQEHPEVSLRDLQSAVKHPDYALAGRLLLGQTMKRLGRWQEAALNYLKALQFADSEIVPDEQAELVFQMYDPLIETHSQEKEEKALVAICDNISALLNRPEWRAQLLQSREKLPPQAEGAPPLLLAEMLLQTRSNEVVESLTTIRTLTDQNLLRTAMEEAYTALIYVPDLSPAAQPDRRDTAEGRPGPRRHREVLDRRPGLQLPRGSNPGLRPAAPAGAAGPDGPECPQAFNRAAGRQRADRRSHPRLSRPGGYLLPPGRPGNQPRYLFDGAAPGPGFSSQPRLERGYPVPGSGYRPPAAGFARRAPRVRADPHAATG